LLVQIAGSLLYKHEIVLYKPSLDESALNGRDQIIQSPSQSVGKQLSDEFGKGMNQANRPVVLNTLGLLSFWQKDNISRVEQVEIPKLPTPN
jgi:hypothetical protein